MTQEPQKPLDSTFLGFIILHWGNLLWSVIAALALIVLILGIRDLSLGNSGSQIAMDYIIFIIISIPRIWFAYPNGLLRGPRFKDHYVSARIEHYNTAGYDDKVSAG